MHNLPLVSIIIPIYNRANLIKETLDTIHKQSYSNWECIIVDDGSTDKTFSILSSYVTKDSRFKCYKRPLKALKGGNAARNFGLEMSSGQLINWFDSDDLMEKSFIEDKVQLLMNKDVDFVVSRCENFYKDGQVKPFFIGANKTAKLNVDNFIQRKVFWVTGDLMVKRKQLGSITFDPVIRSGQEFNFFIKLLANNQLNGVFLNKIVYKRRVHEQSIQGSLNDKIKNKNIQICFLNTYRSVSTRINIKSREILLNTVMATTFNNFLYSRKSMATKELLGYVLKEKGIFSTVIYSISLIMAYSIKKGYNLMLFSRKKYKYNCL